VTTVCSKCRVEKPAEDFRSFRGNMRGECRNCEAAIQRERQQSESGSQREQRLEALRVWRKNNPEKVALNKLKHLAASRKRDQERFCRLYGTKDAPGPQRKRLLAIARAWKQNNHERNAAAFSKWSQKNRDRRRANASRFAEKHRFDSEYRLVCNVRSRVSSIVRGKDKSAKTMELLGCSIEQLRGHLEAKFAPGMSWSNYGKFGWHIDHIRPCASFDFNDRDQQRECFHYTNLQPLWAADNIRKKDKLEIA
jgi:hypothetical protein